MPVLTIALILFIWGHSMMPGEVSGEESGIVADFLRSLFSLEMEDLDHIVRKCAHFTEYAVLGAIIMLDTLVLAKRFFHMAALFTGLFVPVVDETIQIFAVDRSGVLTDVWLDFFGFITGLALCALICGTVIKRKGIEIS